MTSILWLILTPLWVSLLKYGHSKICTIFKHRSSLYSWPYIALLCAGYPSPLSITLHSEFLSLKPFEVVLFLFLFGLKKLNVQELVSSFLGMNAQHTPINSHSIMSESMKRWNILKIAKFLSIEGPYIPSPMEPSFVLGTPLCITFFWSLNLCELVLFLLLLGLEELKIISAFISRNGCPAYSSGKLPDSPRTIMSEPIRRQKAFTYNHITP